MTFHIKAGDTAPPVESTLTVDGTVQPLTGATVTFVMRKQGNDTPKVNSAATIVDDSAGTVKYEWSTGDTDTVGYYDAHWKVELSDGTVMHFPNDEYETVRVMDNLE